MGEPNNSDGDETYFAPGARAEGAVLQRDIAFVASNPVIDALLALAGGMLAVLNEERQAIALNPTFTEALGIRNSERAFGLRLGEILRCDHADEPPHGCGTTEFCSSCGAAVAIVACLTTETTQERKCILTTTLSGAPREMCFHVRACPMRSGQRRYVVLFLHDITTYERLEAQNRVLLHDVNNHLVALLGASELLALDGAGDLKLLNTVSSAARHVRGAVALHRALAQDSERQRPATLEDVPLAPFVDELVYTYTAHPASAKKEFVVSGADTVPTVRTDPALLMRVLGNMVVNAFEATAFGGAVRFAIEQTSNHLVFSVHNDTVIPREVALRVFQLHHTTKPGPGRGLGTYSMKLIGEQLLGGKVEFSSTEAEGTTFRFLHPT